MRKRLCFAIILLILLLLTAISGCNKSAGFSFQEETYFVEPEEILIPKLKSPFIKKYTLSSSNPTIAKVQDKQVIALKEGMVTITALSGDRVTTATVYIIHQDEYEGGLPFSLPEYVNISFFIEDYAFTSPMVVRKGQAPIASYNLSRGGYKIDGWYSDKDCTQKYDFNEIVTENVIVYGKWIMLEPEYIFEKAENAENASYISGLRYPNVPYTDISNLPLEANDGSAIIGIAKDAFKDKTTIESIIIPDSYTEIGVSAFEGCTNLEDVQISNNSALKIIRNSAFEACENLATIHLPAQLQKIGSAAFRRCDALSIQHDLPQALKTLEKYVFSQTATASIDLEYVEKLDEGAFANCPNLTAVVNTHNIVKCAKSVFTGTAIYNSSISNNDRVAYIDTLLVGATTINPFELKSDITLIADNALRDTKFKHIILTIQGALPMVGVNCFDSSMAIVIDEEYYQETCEDNEQWKGYRGQIYIQFEKDGDFDILKRVHAGIEKFSIRKYKGQDIHLNLDTLGFDIEDIWQGAFTNNDDRYDKLKLKTLTLTNVERIRDFAINNVNSLIAIMILGDTRPTLEDTMSIQQTEALKFYVPETLLGGYRSSWAQHRNYIYSYSIVENGLAISTVIGENQNGDGQGGEQNSGSAFVIQYFGDESSLTIPDKKDGYIVKKIEPNAFRHNYTLESITIGSNVIAIGECSFYNTNIKTIEFLSEFPPEVDERFLLSNNYTGLEKIFVPLGSKVAYEEVLPMYSNIIIEKLD